LRRGRIIGRLSPARTNATIFAPNGFARARTPKCRNAPFVEPPRERPISWRLLSVMQAPCWCTHTTEVSIICSEQHFAAITKDNAEVFQVLICQVAKDRKINAVFSKESR